MFAIENKKPACQFYCNVRKCIADLNSISVEDLYLDVLDIDEKELGIYFSAVYGKMAAMKMYLIKELQNHGDIYAAHLIYVMMVDFLNVQKYNAKHKRNAESLSLGNLPFANMANAKIVKAAERDINKWGGERLDIRETMALGNALKHHKRDRVTKEGLLKMKADRIEQGAYIRTQDALAERNVANGVACMRKHAVDYNKLTDHFKQWEETLLHLFFQIKYAQDSKPGARSIEKEAWFKTTKKFTELGETIASKDIFQMMANLTDEAPLELGVSSSINWQNNLESNKKRSADSPSKPKAAAI
jgi:ribosomal protein S15P/S13E